jgi:thiamine-phosphate pyrophosphorylase
VTLPRLIVVVPRGGEPCLSSGLDLLVVREEDLTKCHSVAEVHAAAGSPFVTISPVAPTASKPGYGPPLGAEGVRSAVAAAGTMPVFALGGVTPANAPEFLAAGAHGVAVMGPVQRAEDPANVIAEYLRALP